MTGAFANSFLLLRSFSESLEQPGVSDISSITSGLSAALLGILLLAGSPTEMKIHY